MKKKQAQLHTLNAYMHRECHCALKSTARNPVVGAGSADADIVFIGEAPGKQEDLKGTPFIGAAGKFLDKMLASINLARESVYITNIVKYRPPGNRDPKPDEVSACLSWLHAEIAIIEPKLVVLLGRHAMRTFFPKEKISKSHGKVFEKRLDNCGTTTFYILYHPAAALYNGSLRDTLFADFARIPKITAAHSSTEN